MRASLGLRTGGYSGGRRWAESQEVPCRQLFAGSQADTPEWVANANQGGSCFLIARQRASWWYGGSKVPEGTCRAGIGTVALLKTGTYRAGLAPINQYQF
jgi:hypothetical protein